MKRIAQMAATLVALMLALASTAIAQGGTIGGSTGGGNAVVTDSLKRLANGTAAAPSLAFLNSAGTGLYRFGADTLGIATGGALTARLQSTGLVFANGRGTISLSSANDGQGRILGGDGTAAAPGYDFNGQTGNGMYRSASNTIAWATAGAHSLSLTGGAAATLTGGAGNMTIRAGTGNCRQLTLSPTNNTGAAYNSILATGCGAGLDTINIGNGNTSLARVVGLLRVYDGTVSRPSVSFYTDSTSGMFAADNGSSIDTLSFASRGAAFFRGLSDTALVVSKAKAPALTAAAGTPNSVCMNATTKEVVENAATSCVVSSLRYKENVRPLTLAEAFKIVKQLQSFAFNYKQRGRTAIGGVAEQADTVDARLVSRDAQGRPNSINYEQVTMALLTVVQEQQRVIDSLRRNSPRSAASAVAAGPSTTELALLVGAGAAAAGLAARRRRRAA